jgi:hypothetical protein
LDHTGGIAPSYGETRRSPEGLWIVGPSTDWHPVLSPTLPLSPADFNHCYGCEFVRGHGFRSFGHGTYHDRRAAQPIVAPEQPIVARAPSPSVVLPAAASRR